MHLIRRTFFAAVAIGLIVPGCGVLDKLRGKKDAGAFDDASVAADDAATAVDAAVATVDDGGDAGVATLEAGTPIIGACKVNDVADCTNKCQKLNNQSSCVNLGIMFANGTGVPQDTGKAATLFQGACNAGIAAGCDHVGLALQFGRGIQTDLPRAMTTFQKGCDLKNAEACNRLALMAERGQGAPKDAVKAVTFYQKSCDLGDAFGCGNLANHLANGEGVPKDPARANALRKQACDKGDKPACDALSNSGVDAGTGGGGNGDCASQKKAFLLECNRTRKLQDVPCEKQAATTPVLAKCRGK